MTTAAWTIMSLSLCSVLTLVTFCVTRVLALPEVEVDELKGPLEIDTGDVEEPD